MTETVLVLACGALARELVAVRQANGWDHVHIRCLPHQLHNTPSRIPQAVKTEIERYRGHYSRLFVAYGDCGTSGELDRVLAGYGIERLPGAHCYEFYAGHQAFTELADAEPGTFYLTDFLARHFDRIVRDGLGLDRRPGLLPAYFGRYKRLVYLSQAGCPALRDKARAHAAYLGLKYLERPTGLASLQLALVPHATGLVPSSDLPRGPA